MCGRATYKLTWEEIVALYRLTLDQLLAEKDYEAWLSSNGPAPHFPSKNRRV